MAERDGKLFYSIGEVKEMTGIAPHVLRYWEREFNLLRPRKDRSGRRAYRAKDIEKIETIKDLLYRKKYSIAGAKRCLQMETEGDASNRALLSRIRRELNAIKERLQEE